MSLSAQNSIPKVQEPYLLGQRDGCKSLNSSQASFFAPDGVKCAISTRDISYPDIKASLGSLCGPKSTLYILSTDSLLSRYCTASCPAWSRSRANTAVAWRSLANKAGTSTALAVPPRITNLLKPKNRRRESASNKPSTTTVHFRCRVLL